MILGKYSLGWVDLKCTHWGAAFGINYAQGFDLDVELHSIDVDDVAPPIV